VAAPCVRQWPRGLDLCPQSQITQQPTDDNGDDNDEEGGEEEEEEEEEMGASDEGAADATTTTTFDPVAGRIVCSTWIDEDDDNWSVEEVLRLLGPIKDDVDLSTNGEILRHLIEP
jgi:hypothetical protein